MNKYKYLNDEDLVYALIEEFKKASEDEEFLDDYSEVREELRRRLFASRVGLGLLSAIHHEADGFSPFDKEGFKSDGEFLQQILYNTHTHFDLIDSVLDGDMDIDDAELLIDRNINSSGEIREDSEEEDEQEET